MKKVYEWKVYEFNEEQPSNDNSIDWRATFKW